MNDLSRFFLNPFDSRNVSFGRLLSFTTDHLGRLEANDESGLFTARRAATAAALAAVNAAYEVDDSKLGLRKAHKQAARAFRKALPAIVGRINVAVKSEFGERAPEVEEIFPGGRTIFRLCRQDTLAAHLETLVTGLQAHAAVLDPALVAQAESLKADWAAVIQSSESASAVKASAEAHRRAARRVLQRELFLNVLALAQAYPLEPAKLRLFMDQSLL